MRTWWDKLRGLCGYPLELQSKCNHEEIKIPGYRQECGPVMVPVGGGAACNCCTNWAEYAEKHPTPMVRAQVRESRTKYRQREKANILEALRQLTAMVEKQYSDEEEIS